MKPEVAQCFPQPQLPYRPPDRKNKVQLIKKLLVFRAEAYESVPFSNTTRDFFLNAKGPLEDILEAAHVNSS
jgi:hypothetical protein